MNQAEEPKNEKEQAPAELEAASPEAPSPKDLAAKESKPEIKPPEAKVDSKALEEAERNEFLEAMEQNFEVRESNRGEMIEGTVISVGKEYLFIDLGSKSEGVLSIEEYRGDGEDVPGVGDTIEACVISTGSSGLILSRKLAKGIRDREFLAEAARSKIPIEGRVVGRNKGGFDVEVGGIRAFCPISQIELRFCEDPDVHLEERYTFLITKFDDSGRRPDMVVSRKDLLRAEAAHLAEELRETLKEGDVVSGPVTNIRDFGAFVDLGGIEGLLPISELSHSRVEKVEDVLHVGEEVHVQVVSFDREKDRISLSLKRLESDPWDDVMQMFAEGSRVTGKVVRMKPFGAFVELIPGVDGLIHISNMNTPDRIQHPNAILSDGQELQVQVISVDPSQRRIALARVAADGEFGDVPLVGAVMNGKVDNVAPFGVFVKLGPGRTGLVPNVELGTVKGADNRKDFPAGADIKVKVLEVTENGRRIRLSHKAVAEDEERKDFEGYLGGDDVGSGFGTFADLLKKK